jgi:hypothetical protein
MSVTQYTTTAGHLIDGVLILNGTIDLNGTSNALILDADADTHISAPTDDQIDISIGGADDFTITANSFNVLTGSTIAGPSSTFYSCSPIAVQQDLSGGGAITITEPYTAWTTTGADPGTLADGVVKGQYKKIQLVDDGGTGTLTPNSFTSGTSVAFADIGDTLELVWDGTGWVAIAVYNVADGTSAPVIT